LNYSKKFKIDVFQALKQDIPMLKRAVKAIENKKENSLRIVLEDSIDDEKLYNYKIKNKKALKYVNPFFKETHKKRNQVYSQFMNEYLGQINKEKVYVSNN
jgi:hypothetical protein